MQGPTCAVLACPPHGVNGADGCTGAASVVLMRAHLVLLQRSARRPCPEQRARDAADQPLCNAVDTFAGVKAGPCSVVTQVAVVTATLHTLAQGHTHARAFAAAASWDLGAILTPTAHLINPFSGQVELTSKSVHNCTFCALSTLPHSSTRGDRSLMPIAEHIALLLRARVHGCRAPAAFVLN